MALRWRSKIVLIKMESAYGTDPTPEAANGMLLTDVTLAPMQGQDVSRELELPWLGGQEVMPVGLHCVLSGSFELVPSGTAGVAPAWGPLMRAAGCSQTVVTDTSVTYAPVTDAHESAYAYFWIGGTLHKIAGIRADLTLAYPAQGIPRGRWVGTGLYAGVADTARTAPTLTGFKRPRVVSSAYSDFEIGNVALPMRSYSLAMRNDVQPRLLVGLEEVLIVDRADQISATVQATPLATYNPYAAAIAGEAAVLAAVEMVHGTAAGYVATLVAPTAQQQRLSGFEQQQGIAEWPLVFNALPASGNDQWSLALT